MCLILDTCALSSFFDKSSANHADFEPAFNWVIHGKGKLIIGGVKYKSELKAASKFLKLIVILDRASKVVSLVDAEVDLQQSLVEQIEDAPDFDDPHLIALARVSRCAIICTNDVRAIPFIKNKKFYVGRGVPPRIYKSIKNASLLTDANIADICKPADKLKKSVVSSLGIV